MTATEETVPFGVASALTESAELLMLETDTDGLLGRLARIAAEALPHLGCCGITFAPDGRPRTVAAHGEAAWAVNRAQQAAGQGPGLESLRRAAEVVVTDVRADDRWPAFRAAALQAGVGAALSVPLLGAAPCGVFSLYAPRPYAFADADRRAARLFAEHAGLILRAAERYRDSATLCGQLREALGSRAVIDQAKGIVMATQRCSADQAFRILVRMSQNANRKLRDIAAEIVASAPAG